MSIAMSNDVFFSAASHLKRMKTIGLTGYIEWLTQ